LPFGNPNVLVVYYTISAQNLKFKIFYKRCARA